MDIDSIKNALDDAFNDLDNIAAAADKAYTEGNIFIWNCLNEIWQDKLHKLNQIAGIINRA